MFGRHLIAPATTVDEEILDKHHRQWCGRQSLAPASGIIQPEYDTLKAESWEYRRPFLLCTQQTKVTMPVMDKDEYQRYHAICKDTVPSAVSTAAEAVGVKGVSLTDSVGKSMFWPTIYADVSGSSL